MQDDERDMDGLTVRPVRTAEDEGQAPTWLSMGREAARQGQPQRARRYFLWATTADPTCVDAWLWLAWVSTEPDERRTYLRRVLALEPTHTQARAEMAKLAPASRSGRDAGRLFGWVGLVVLALASLLATSLIGEAAPVASSAPPAIPSPTPDAAQVLVPLVPEMEAALAAADWGRAQEVLDRMWQLDPEGRNADDWAFALHQQHAQALVEAGQLEAALEVFDRAIAAQPMEAAPYIRQRLVAGYLTGKNQMVAGDWAGAVASLTPIYAGAPSFQDTGALLAQAHLALGVGYQEAGQWQQARAEFQRVLDLQPNHAEAQERLNVVTRKLFPAQKVVVDITEQRMYVYENDQLIWNWPASTGEPGRPTAPGHWQILDKIPMAYASTWGLQMPYWMGIYWAGSLENGIHGPPINRYGQVMWEGYIGRPVSYGCVILSSENVRTLYNWIEIGTPVIIQY
jgi:hypothetical protein